MRSISSVSGGSVVSSSAWRRRGRGLALAVAGAAALVGCGGSVSSVDGASSGSSGASSGGSSGSSGASSSGGGGCTTSALQGSRACVPGFAKDQGPITLTIDATENCLGCFTKLNPCKVAVTGTKISIGMSTTTCPPPGDQACPAVCMLSNQECELPPLAVGEYDVVMEGEGPRTGLPPRKLVVTADASMNSCGLPTNGMAPPPLDGSKYARNCNVDADCVIARDGNMCQPCGCPTTAISKSEAARHGADARAAYSLCVPDASGIVCAACPPVKAMCDTSSGLSGTCKLVPGP